MIVSHKPRMISANKHAFPLPLSLANQERPGYLLIVLSQRDHQPGARKYPTFPASGPFFPPKPLAQLALWCLWFLPQGRNLISPLILPFSDAQLFQALLGRLNRITQVVFLCRFSFFLGNLTGGPHICVHVRLV